MFSDSFMGHKRVLWRLLVFWWRLCVLLSLRPRFQLIQKVCEDTSSSSHSVPVTIIYASLHYDALETRPRHPASSPPPPPPPDCSHCETLLEKSSHLQFIWVQATQIWWQKRQRCFRGHKGNSSFCCTVLLFFISSWFLICFSPLWPAASLGRSFLTSASDRIKAQRPTTFEASLPSAPAVSQLNPPIHPH